MKKVLVTGGAGFVGSHLAEYLLGLGVEVYVLDDLSTGRQSNISHLMMHPLFHFVPGTVTDQTVLEELIKNTDSVYHLAASVGVKHIVANLVGSIANNVHGTEAVLELSARYGNKILLTSSSEVYGRESRRPFSESDDVCMGAPHKTRWSYACGKALDEYLAFAYYYERGLPITVVRLFNTVGERQLDTYGMVLPTFIRQALRQEPLTVYGDGQQARCFCHVSDVVPALVALMDHPRSVGEVYNIGSDQEIVIDELASKIIQLLRSSSSRVYVPYQQAYTRGFDDIERRVPNIAKARELIGFAPKLRLDEIIQRVAASLSVVA